MANTTNYNWETPDDTDLVKDGAAAIRTLGSSIDTTTKSLNPETTLGDIAYRSATANTKTRLAIGSNGQVLTVAGGVPSWATPTTGDIEGVTAGTGISGGGTSGTVTITNSMATEITAAGDIIVGTGSGTFDNLPIGTTGQVLTADTTVSPYKVKWATASGSSGPAFSAYRSSSAQSINQTTWTKVQLNSENFDTANAFDSTTNYRFTPATAGYYQLNANLGFDNSATGRCLIAVYKNGTEYARLLDMSGNYAAPEVGGATLVYLNGSTDYVELFARADNTGTRTIYFGNEYTQFSGVWVRS